ncbi:MAG: rhodanese-like domain-containing protein [Roseburia sp.]|uniref:rhodanese-like domain-containing protein n=1 Tax=Roseburia sp. 831b TaxID=1261635 RepID=UPI000952818A|nr:rhodanese-like domain-containing protein [Roseburia sp. 831b]MDD6216774.1 rhodanese-like domain-containing protein [Roseburia sp.]MDY5882986.1 rhodanese-like domain-containing protein [Roseburia sp.]WVK72197.1 rhodanese-like domain-containing protein [Roseburia sp. 831b]
MAFYLLHPREFEDIFLKKRAVIIDVREREDYRKFHLRGAINCPYDEMERWMFQLKKGRTYILYCQYGSTSLMAARRMSHQGFEVYTIVGGIEAIQKYQKMGPFS